MAKFTKLTAMAFLIFGAFTAAHANPPTGWDGMGTITNIFVGNSGVYETSPSALVYLSDGTCFAYVINTSDIVKTWTGQLFEAKANGQGVIIRGTGSTQTNTGCKYVQTVWIY